MNSMAIYGFALAGSVLAGSMPSGPMAAAASDRDDDSRRDASFEARFSFPTICS